jgi:hypothetical protein
MQRPFWTVDGGRAAATRGFGVVINRYGAARP